MSRTPGSAASMESTSSRAAASVAAASSSGRRQGRRRAPCTGEGSRGGVGREKGREREGEVKVEDNNFGGFFFAYIHATWCRIKGYGPKWHNLTSSECQISILRVRGPKWHLESSSRAAGVFNSFFNIVRCDNTHQH